jgi:hypothetical protein
MPRETLIKIIELANLAPSGGNSQPWTFEIEQDALIVEIHPEVDHPVMNYRNRGTLFSFGALQANIAIAAKYFGYTAEVTYDDTATLTKILVRFEKDKGKDTSLRQLYEHIESRTSNRKPYSEEEIDESIIKNLKDPFTEEDDISVSFAKKSDIKKLAYHMSADIEINMQNKTLHQLLFKEVLWEKEDQLRKPGLYTLTMEMKPPQNHVFKLLSRWKVMKFLKKLNFPKKMHEQVAAKAARTGAIGLITTKKNTDESYVKAGSLFQTLWLKSTASNLSMQIVAGVPFLYQQLKNGDRSVFSNEDAQLLDDSYLAIKKIFNLTEAEVILAFRLGSAEKPSARSLKRPPVIK